MSDKPHGARRYAAGCRCDTCRMGMRIRDRQRAAAQPKPLPKVHGTAALWSKCDCTECSKWKRVAETAAPKPEPVVKQPRKPRTITHGLLSRYRKGCRCEACMIHAPQAVPITHGASGYARGCRCDTCRAGRREQQRTYRAGLRTSAEPKGTRTPTDQPKAARKPAEHGSLAKYNHGKCRCAECVAAHSAYRAARRDKDAAAQRAGRQRRAAAGVPEGAKHGTPHTYNTYRCRCEPCSTAQREMKARLRAAKRDAA